MSEQPTYEQLQERKQQTHPILRQIIDRDCHVGTSYRAVVKHVISKLKEGHQSFRGMPREDRHQMMQQCIDIHRFNRAEYQAVMYPRYADAE